MTQTKWPPAKPERFKVILPFTVLKRLDCVLEPTKTAVLAEHAEKLSAELMNAIMDALAAHTTMSKQALESQRVRDGLKDVLLGPAQLYEALRERGAPG